MLLIFSQHQTFFLAKLLQLNLNSPQYFFYMFLCIKKQTILDQGEKSTSKNQKYLESEPLCQNNLKLLLYETDYKLPYYIQIKWCNKMIKSFVEFFLTWILKYHYVKKKKRLIIYSYNILIFKIIQTNSTPALYWISLTIIQVFLKVMNWMQKKSAKK